RYFVTEIGLRTHVADRHPWRSLPPAQRRLTPTRAAMPEPTWLRERQAAAADFLSSCICVIRRQTARHRCLSGYDEYPPPDYDLTPFELTRSLDAVDSSARKRRDLATTRRPWYDSEDYTGPRNLMEKRPGGYFDDQNEMEAGLDDGQGSYPRGNGGAYSGRRMRHEIEERDSRIETLRMEIDRLWDERMRLLKHEAEGIRAVKDQGGAGLPYEGRRNQRGFMDDNGGQFGQGHAFQPVLPHSRMQLYRQQPPQPQPQPKQHHYMGMRRPADY
uniref:CCDC50_N domain-containing protein n=1 Tax=Macrostomum lignano TaxID=282301 RepID=A0A1I8J5H4_9PLAT